MCVCAILIYQDREKAISRSKEATMVVVGDDGGQGTPLWFDILMKLHCSLLDIMERIIIFK